ncbi:hypothetical protein GF366_02175 [Candidatus Peregrinibacteria bacterium]|nr:hypothetical protein [Candidatus Peregrinibacteria bacterium]
MKTVESSETQTRKPCDKYWYIFLEEAGRTEHRHLDSSDWLPDAINAASEGEIDHGELRALLLSRYMTERMSYCTIDPVATAVAHMSGKNRIRFLEERIAAIKSGDRIVFDEFGNLDLPEIDRKELYLGGLRSGFMHDAIPFVEQALELVREDEITLADFRWALRDGFVNRMERRTGATKINKWWRGKRPISRLEAGKSVTYSPPKRAGSYRVPSLPESLPPMVRNEVRDKVQAVV